MRDNRYQLYSAALEYFGNYDSKLDPRLKLELSLFFLTIGFIGFTVNLKILIQFKVSAFGLVNAVFMFFVGIGISLMTLLTYQKIKKDGLISYLPGPLKRLLLNWYAFIIKIFIGLCSMFSASYSYSGQRSA